ncbi:MAG: heavy metal translocating P-type ATPase [Rhodospirillales bacterium]|nr:heavy metal translocating P-type ATPase [Rhodospirillales bacterium]
MNGADRMSEWRRGLNLALLASAVAGLAAGAVAARAGAPDWAGWLMAAGALPVLAAVLADSAASLLRLELGLDLIALLSIGGAVALGADLVAAVIGIMLAGGRALEDYAAARARREMSALLNHVPRSARRYRDGQIESVPLEAVGPGDRLLVASGEAIPTDGRLLGGPAVIDEQTLTGESLPVTRQPGEALRSGTVNAGAPFDMQATTSAAASTFAGIVRMVRAAQEARAPAARLADQAAFVFTPLAMALAGGAWWLTGDAMRGLAVLVVATPCPLILGVPVAIVSGLSRCAGRGVLVKGGGALERLARARALFLDKTGTLTSGLAELGSIEAAPGCAPDEVLRLAASLDQVSRHILAEALLTAARARGLPLESPTGVEESPGSGLTGEVGAHHVVVGSYAHVMGALDDQSGKQEPPAWAGRVLRRIAREGATAAFVAVDGALAGALLLSDTIRPDTPRALRLLRRAGIAHITMLTGDRRDVATTIGRVLGVDEVLAEQRPQDKLAAITAARAQGVCVMVGDGVNDAPALAAADVGVAMGARGAGASSEAADIVLLSDRLDRLAEAVVIARGTRRIAVQTVAVGMSLSLLAMAAAAAGLLPPVAGALLQEAIDVAAILNALRVLRVAIPGRTATPLAASEVARLHGAHQELEAVLAQLRSTADILPTLPPAQAAATLAEIEELVRERLLAHERDDDTQLYPVIARALGGDDPMAAMHHTHRAMQQLGRLLRGMVQDLPREAPPDSSPDAPTGAPAAPLDPAAINDLRSLLYGLEAIARLHFAQEDELYHALVDPKPPAAAPPGR